MNTTDNFDLKVYEGDDLFNPLTVENANTEAIDEQLFKNQNAGVQIATELFTQNVHAITRNVPDASVFRFTAVSRFTAGDVFEVDGVQVTALTTSGEQLPDGAYVIGSEVLCVLKGTVLTVFISTSSVNTAKNAEKLGGQLPAHYATAGDLGDVAQIAQSAGELAEGNTQEINALKETKSGVLTPSFTSGSITTSANYCTRSGNVVEFAFAQNSSAAFVTANQTVATLPEGFRPSSPKIAIAQVYSNTQFLPIKCNVTADGKVSFSHGSNQIVSFNISMTFIV